MLVSQIFTHTQYVKTEWSLDIVRVVLLQLHCAL